LSEAPAATDADQIQLSASASIELNRARKLEALEAAVAGGSYSPRAQDIASSLVSETISGSVEGK